MVGLDSFSQPDLGRYSRGRLVSCREVRRIEGGIGETKSRTVKPNVFVRSLETVYTEAIPQHHGVCLRECSER